MKQTILSREEVYKIIDSERAYQDAKWNEETTTSGGNHSATEWFSYMEDYIAEAKHFLARNPAQEATPTAMALMRKVVAMGVCAMEQLGSTPRITEVIASVEAAEPPASEKMLFKFEQPI